VEKKLHNFTSKYEEREGERVMSVPASNTSEKKGVHPSFWKITELFRKKRGPSIPSYQKKRVGKRE